MVNAGPGPMRRHQMSPVTAPARNLRHLQQCYSALVRAHALSPSPREDAALLARQPRPVLAHSPLRRTQGGWHASRQPEQAIGGVLIPSRHSALHLCACRSAPCIGTQLIRPTCTPTTRQAGRFGDQPEVSRRRLRYRCVAPLHTLFMPPQLPQMSISLSSQPRMMVHNTMSGPWPEPPVAGAVTPLTVKQLCNTPGFQSHLTPTTIPVLPLMSPSATPALGLGFGGLTTSCGPGQSLEQIMSVPTDPMR